MKIALKLLGSVAICALLAGCSVTVEHESGRCGVHDYKGRKWAAEGPRACRIAKHKCERWHSRNQPNGKWACMYN